MQVIREPARNDVIGGRGNGANLHVGNIYFRSLVATHKSKYLAACAKDKKIIKQQIVYHIQNVSATRSTPGRFLTKKATGLWKCMSQKDALKKTGQALREGALKGRMNNEHRTPQDRTGNYIAISINHRNEDKNNSHNNSTNSMSTASLAASLDMMDLIENEPTSYSLLENNQQVQRNDFKIDSYRFQSLSGTQLVLEDEGNFMFGEHKTCCSENGTDDQSKQSMDDDRSSTRSEFFPEQAQETSGQKSRPPLRFIQNPRFISLSGTSMSLRSSLLEDISFRSIETDSIKSNLMSDSS